MNQAAADNASVVILRFHPPLPLEQSLERSSEGSSEQSDIRDKPLVQQLV